uniref:F-ORF n=1 Tax=Cuneopsis rufescens TaxID=232581 RepID=UPI0021CC67C9|nr:F-ORF [Cuneopsis rufescens]UWM10821.1 F-ORF [Cuneopsis rufescens]
MIPKQKLPNQFSFSLLISIIILCLIPTIPLFTFLNEPELLNQNLHSMDLNNQSSQPKTNDHPIIASPASTDLTNTQPEQ